MMVAEAQAECSAADAKAAAHNNYFRRALARVSRDKLTLSLSYLKRLRSKLAELDARIDAAQRNVKLASPSLRERFAKLTGIPSAASATTSTAAASPDGAAPSSEPKSSPPRAVAAFVTFEEEADVLRAKQM